MMKNYQMKIELKGSKPLIWRRVLISTDASFEELHDVIQTVFDFEHSHLYIFFLPDHTMKVTNDEEAYEVHQEYLENQEQIEKTLLALDSPFAMRQLENLRIAIHKPEAVKLAPYLQTGAVLDYIYDFGANWEVSITVEDRVESEPLDYPILLAGEQVGPGEKMGSLADFEEFLEAYHNPRHPDYKFARQWGKEQGFTEYDGEGIQRRLKSLSR